MKVVTKQPTWGWANAVTGQPILRAVLMIGGSVLAGTKQSTWSVAVGMGIGGLGIRGGGGGLAKSRAGNDQGGEVDARRLGVPAVLALRRDGKAV